MLNSQDCTLYTSGLRGAETCFGENAEQWGIGEVVFTYAGHAPDREKNLVRLSEEDLKRGDISMELVSRLMNRNYYQADKIRKVLQTIFHMVINGHQVFAVGTILPDNTVKGGTGWAVELAKLFNRPLAVYDQNRSGWYTWQHSSWSPETPRIAHQTFVGSGTRNLADNGRQAIEELFRTSFAHPGRAQASRL